MDRKTNFNITGTSLAVVVLLAVVSFFSGMEEEKRPRKIVLAHDKGIVPSFQKNFALHGRMAEQVTGQGFVPVPSQTTDLYTGRMMAALPTRDAPELFTWWGGHRVRELVDKDLVNDLTPLWDKHGDEFAPGLRRAYTIDGRVYGFPYSVEYWAVWYNKPLFKRLGLKPPATWEAFIDLCERLRENQVPPILSSLQEEWYSFVWFEQVLMGQDPDLYRALCEGRVAYTDPRVKKAVGVWAEMIRRDFFTDPSVNMFTNAGHLWNEEKFAMVLCGSWFYSTALVSQGVDENSIGVFILPSRNSSTGCTLAMESGPVLTAKNALNPGAAEKIADWWMGPGGNAHFSRMFRSYSPNQKTDQDYLPGAKKKLLADIDAMGCRVVNRYWEATPSPICQAAVKHLGKFILNPDRMDEVLQEIETAAQRYWEEN